MKLTTPVREIPYIGEKYVEKLRNLGIKTVEDLVFHIPNRYVDFRYTSQIANLKAGEVVTVFGQITNIQNVYTKKGKLMQVASLSDGDKKIPVLWFNQPYLTRALPPGTALSISGKVSFWQKKLVIFSPQYEKQVKEDSVATGKLIPIYPETAGVSSKWIAARIKYILKHIEELIGDDYLDENILNNYKLKKLHLSIVDIHLPTTPDDAKNARERLAFDELLQIQVENNLKRLNWQKSSQTYTLKVDQSDVDTFINNLPFELTPSQKRTVGEVLEDLKKEFPMNRLLEGDVGSGKTIVAAIAAYTVFKNGLKTAIMAPTQILASQHFKTLDTLLTPLGIKISLVTSDTSSVFSSDADIFVGTHALIQKNADLKNVALVVIDEQHKFGVKQRGTIAEKSVSQKKNPNILTMTATPIPRTIALTLYGDLDLSTLDELPKGRQKITTWVVGEKKRKKAYGWIAEQIEKEKAQVFIVCPLIEESESEKLKEVKSVKLEFQKVKKIFPDFKVGLLHGQMKAVEKDKIIKDFKNKKYHILVSTPVVEVGIDIPDATIMVIETAERYGLAQLHQLRGRVGRSSKKSYCLLFPNKMDGKVKDRLEAMTKSHSGRELAEIDLKLRGVGEIFGTRQHGASEFKIATWEDIDLIKQTRYFALEIVNNQEEYKKILMYYKSKQPAAN